MLYVWHFSSAGSRQSPTCCSNALDDSACSRKVLASSIAAHAAACVSMMMTSVSVLPDDIAKHTDRVPPQPPVAMES